MDDFLRKAYDQLVTAIAKSLGVDGDIDDGSPLLGAIDRLKQRAETAEKERDELRSEALFLQATISDLHSERARMVAALATIKEAIREWRP